MIFSLFAPIKPKALFFKIFLTNECDVYRNSLNIIMSLITPCIFVCRISGAVTWVDVVLWVSLTECSQIVSAL